MMPLFPFLADVLYGIVKRFLAAINFHQIL
jgi:hypothetical protein